MKGVVIIMESKVILLVLLTVLLVVGLCYVGIKEMQRIGLDKIRESVYKAFLVAEHRFQYGENDAKFCYVVNVAKELIPAPFNIFITEGLLKEVIQMWFNLCKDLLDDGNMNGTETDNNVEDQEG